MPPRQALLALSLVSTTYAFRVNRMMNSSFRNLAPTSLSVGQGISVSDILKSPQWPDKWPFTAKDFSRQVQKSEFWQISETVRHTIPKIYNFTRPIPHNVDRMRAPTISSTFNLDWFTTLTMAQ